MKPRAIPKRRSKAARALAEPQFTQKVVETKKKRERLSMADIAQEWDDYLKDKYGISETMSKED